MSLDSLLQVNSSYTEEFLFAQHLNFVKCAISYLHRNVQMKFLTCEPNLFKENNYVDEADMFYLDPDKWFISNKDSIESITYLVIFENLYQQLKESKSEVTKRFVKKFFSCERFFYSFAISSNRLDKYLLLYKLYGKNTQPHVNKSEL